MFRGLSFISFDADSQQYHCAFLDSRSGKIQSDCGTYNESEKRIVFNGREDTGAAEKGAKGARADHNVRVVVELLSPTQHRVTMYNLDAASPTGRPGQPRDPSTPTAALDRETDVIYRATYTKASGDDAAQYRRLIQEPTLASVTPSARTADPTLTLSQIYTQNRSPVAVTPRGASCSFNPHVRAPRPRWRFSGR